VRIKNIVTGFYEISHIIQVSENFEYSTIKVKEYDNMIKIEN